MRVLIVSFSWLEEMKVRMHPLCSFVSVPSTPLLSPQVSSSRLSNPGPIPSGGQSRTTQCQEKSSKNTQTIRLTSSGYRTTWRGQWSWLATLPIDEHGGMVEMPSVYVMAGDLQIYHHTASVVTTNSQFNPPQRTEGHYSGFPHWGLPQRWNWTTSLRRTTQT